MEHREAICICVEMQWSAHMFKVNRLTAFKMACFPLFAQSNERSFSAYIFMFVYLFMLHVHFHTVFCILETSGQKLNGYH